MALGDEILWLEGDEALLISPNAKQLYGFDGRSPRLLTLDGGNRVRAEALAAKARATARLAFTLPRESRYRRPDDPAGD